ncbi:MAG: hypothetical protein LBS21_00995 [Clostridiales bacterium]|jgi:hypothetical protein|nr:hypothetical protein [Clostridiales bacterium]
MKKDLSFVCDYWKKLVMPPLPENFVVAPHFTHGLTDDEIRKGIAAYREFLYLLYDKLAENKDKIDAESGRTYDPYGELSGDGTARIKKRFPAFFDLPMIILTLGYHGKIETHPDIRLTVRGADTFIVIDPVTEKYQSLIRMKSERKIEMFRLLTEAGLEFKCADFKTGADFSKEVDFSKIETVHIKSAKNKYLPVGLKLIADAITNNKYYIKLENLFGGIILRGDFKPLQNAVAKKYKLNVRDYANAQPPEVKEWILDIDTLLSENGCTDAGSFTYVKRNTGITYGMVCLIYMNVSVCRIAPGVNNLAKENNILDILPNDMAEKVINAMQSAECEIAPCLRKTGNALYYAYYKGEKYTGCRHAESRCQFSGKSCRFKGFNFDLYEPDTRKWMRKWIEMELAVSENS